MAVTADEPHDNLSVVYGYLKSLGIQINDTNLNENGQFVFITQLGSPEKTLFNTRLVGLASLTMDITLYGLSTCYYSTCWSPAATVITIH